MSALKYEHFTTALETVDVRTYGMIPTMDTGIFVRAVSGTGKRQELQVSGVHAEMIDGEWRIYIDASE